MRINTAQTTVNTNEKEILEVFPSLSSMLPRMPLRGPHSKKDWRDESSSDVLDGITPEQWLQKALSGTTEEYSSRLELLQSVREDIRQELPRTAAPVRAKTWGRRGGRVNVPAVLSGNLSRSRCKWSINEREKELRFCVLVLQSNSPHWADKEHFAWSIAAPLAYADYLEEEHNVLTEVWSSVRVIEAFVPEYAHTVFTRLKTPDTPLHLGVFASLVGPEFYRGCIWKLRETKTLAPTGFYGYSVDAAQTYPRVEEFFSTLYPQGTRGPVLLGPGGTAPIRSLSEAKDWINKQQTILELIA